MREHWDTLWLWGPYTCSLTQLEEGVWWEWCLLDRGDVRGLSESGPYLKFFRTVRFQIFGGRKRGRIREGGEDQWEHSHFQSCHETEVNVKKKNEICSSRERESCAIPHHTFVLGTKSCNMNYTYVRLNVLYKAPTYLPTDPSCYLRYLNTYLYQVPYNYLLVPSSLYL